MLGLGDRLMVDLGLVQRNDYYTGIVFSAYVPHHGAAVLMGGRYDALCGKFGEPMPAVGFAVDVDACAALLSGCMEDEPAPAVLVHGERGFEAEAEQTASLLARQGKLCELSLFASREQAEHYAKGRGIPHLMLVGEQVAEIRTKRKGAGA